MSHGLRRTARPLHSNYAGAIRTPPGKPVPAPRHIKTNNSIIRALASKGRRSFRADGHQQDNRTLMAFHRRVMRGTPPANFHASQDAARSTPAAMQFHGAQGRAPSNRFHDALEGGRPGPPTFPLCAASPPLVRWPKGGFAIAAAAGRRCHSGLFFIGVHSRLSFPPGTFPLAAASPPLIWPLAQPASCQLEGYGPSEPTFLQAGSQLPQPAAAFHLGSREPYRQNRQAG